LRLAAARLAFERIFYGADKPMYYLVAQKEIRSVAELKGKRVGVQPVRGTSDLAARLALKHYGVEPEKDALLIQNRRRGQRNGRAPRRIRERDHRAGARRGGA